MGAARRAPPADYFYRAAIAVARLTGGLLGADVVSVRDFDRALLEAVFEATDRIVGMPPSERREMARGRTLGHLFYEPSTRTRLSFQAAMALIGGTSLGIADVSSSSTQKGESLADTVRTISIYTDALVLRHPLDGSSRFAAEVSDKPVINGGSGTEEHPTQAIQDLYTIRAERGRIDGLSVGIIGDLKYGRTVYSLLQALGNYDVRVSLASPPSLRIRRDSTYDISKRLDLAEHDGIDGFIDDVDVLYVTRVQKERFPDEEEYLRVKGSYVVGLDVLKRMREGAIVMHPLPRLDEIAPEVDSAPQARYFRQAENGMYTRAALLGLILGADGLFPRA